MATSRTSTTTQRRRARSTNDAITLLKSDHRKVEALFDEFESAIRKDRKERIAQEICMELTIHAEVEEQLFYPQVEQALEETDLIAEARVEHSSLKWLIEQISEADSDSELYEAKVKVLKEYVAHHVKEEEKELFPKVKKTELDLKEIGKQIEALKSDLMAKEVTH